MNQQYRVQIATQDLKFFDTTRLERMNSSAATSWPIRWECKTWHSAPCGDTVWKNGAANGLTQYSFTVAGPCLYETRAESRNISLLKLSNKTEILYSTTIYHSNDDSEMGSTIISTSNLVRHSADTGLPRGPCPKEDGRE